MHNNYDVSKRGNLGSKWEYLPWRKYQCLQYISLFLDDTLTHSPGADTAPPPPPPAFQRTPKLHKEGKKRCVRVHEYATF